MAITKRDRHGRALEGTVESGDDFMESIYLDSRLKDMDRVAARVFGDRNAQGAPVSVRARVKADMRPLLRAAIKSAAAARTALLKGRLADFDRDRLHALLCLQMAQVAFRQPYMEERLKAMEAPGGGRPSKAKLAAEWAEQYDSKKRSRLRLSSREIYDDIAERAGVLWTNVRDQNSKHRKRAK